MFGYDPTIYMPKPGSKDIYKVRRCVTYRLGRFVESRFSVFKHNARI
jgi:hypothetical protein